MLPEFAYFAAMYTDLTKGPACPDCGAVMTRVRVIPRLGGLPELTVYQCAPCDHVETVVSEASATAPSRLLVSAP
jgi:hypothetical protein